MAYNVNVVLSKMCDVPTHVARASSALGGDRADVPGAIAHLRKAKRDLDELISTLETPGGDAVAETPRRTAGGDTARFHAWLKLQGIDPSGTPNAISGVKGWKASDAKAKADECGIDTSGWGTTKADVAKHINALYGGGTAAAGVETPRKASAAPGLSAFGAWLRQQGVDPNATASAICGVTGWTAKGAKAKADECGIDTSGWGTTKADVAKHIHALFG